MYFRVSSAADSAAGREKGLKDGGTFRRENAGENFYLMIETRVGEDLETGTDGAAFGVVCTVDESRDAGLDDRAGTHAAGFKRDVESSAGHSIVAEEASRFANHDDFGVRGGVAVANRTIAGAGENFAVMDEAVRRWGLRLRRLRRALPPWRTA